MVVASASLRSLWVRVARWSSRPRKLCLNCVHVLCAVPWCDAAGGCGNRAGAARRRRGALRCEPARPHSADAYDVPDVPDVPGDPGHCRCRDTRPTPTSGNGMSEEPSQPPASPAAGTGRVEQAVVILAVLAFPAPVPHGTWWLIGSALTWSGLVVVCVVGRWRIAARITTLAGLGMIARLSLPRLLPGLVPAAVAPARP
jgi:hypothetical protein